MLYLENLLMVNKNLFIQSQTREGRATAVKSGDWFEMVCRIGHRPDYTNYRSNIWQVV